MKKTIITVVIIGLMYASFILGMFVSAHAQTIQPATKKQLQSAYGYGIPTVDLQRANTQLQPAQEVK